MTVTPVGVSDSAYERKPPLTLKAFLATVAQYWKTFVVVTGMVFALGLTGILLMPARYVSTTQLMVSISGSTTAAAYQNDEVVAGRVNSYIALLTSDVVSQRVIDKLKLSVTAPELAAKVSATNVPPKTSIIDVVVTDDSPEQARRLADAYASEFISYTTALETPTGEDDQKVRVTQVTTASRPHEDRAERIALGVLAALAAVLLGAVAVWIRSLIDPVLRTPHRAAVAAGVPVIGSVTGALADSVDDLEGYRRLRTRLRSMTSTGGGRVVNIASADGEADTTLVASNLGRAMELTGRRSIVVDAGLPGPGAQSATDTPAGQHLGDDTGLVDQAGSTANDRPEPDRGPDGFPDTLSMSSWATEQDLVVTRAAAELIDRLRVDYEHVVIASPPVLSTTAASVLSEYADAVVLIVSTETTKRRDLSRAADNLTATGAPLIGVVLVDKDDDGGLFMERDGALPPGSEQ